MKGMVFKLFEDHVLEACGADTLDALLSIESLSTAGAYTAVGNYDHRDLEVMVGHLATLTNQAEREILMNFGQVLFGALAAGHPAIMAKFNTCIGLLANIETVIHRDVEKLYRNTDLPRFHVNSRDGDRALSLVYQSTKPFADMAEGLIKGAFVHFGVADRAQLLRSSSSGDGRHAQFEISLADGAG